MITYKKFISEIQLLSEEIVELKNVPNLHENDKFRNWRVKLEGTLNQITQSNYLLPCPVKIKQRSFGLLSYETTDEEILNLYNMELNDTYN